MSEEIKELLFLLHNDRLTEAGKRKLEAEIERLNNIIKTKDEGIKAFTEDLCETTEELEKEKKIINALEKWAEDYRFANIFKNKLQELKGDGSNE